MVELFDAQWYAGRKSVPSGKIGRDHDASVRGGSGEYAFSRGDGSMTRPVRMRHALNCSRDGGVGQGETRGGAQGLRPSTNR